MSEITVTVTISKDSDNSVLWERSWVLEDFQITTGAEPNEGQRSLFPDLDRNRMPLVPGSRILNLTGRVVD